MTPRQVQAIEALIGILLVTAGVALYSPRAGLIVLGLLILVLSFPWTFDKP